MGISGIIRGWVFDLLPSDESILLWTKSTFNHELPAESPHPISTILRRALKDAAYRGMNTHQTVGEAFTVVCDGATSSVDRDGCSTRNPDSPMCEAHQLQRAPPGPFQNPSRRSDLDKGPGGARCSYSPASPRISFASSVRPMLPSTLNMLSGNSLTIGSRARARE